MSERENEANTAISPIVRLPEELLARITKYLEAGDVVRLFTSGTKALNHKMLHGGVEEVHADFSDEECPVWRFGLIRCFKRLRHFRLTSPYRMVAGFEWFTLELLPRELQVLELNYLGAVKLWIRNISNGFGSPRVLVHTMNGKFPFLRQLTLTGTDDMWVQSASPRNGSSAPEPFIYWTPGLKQSLLDGLPMSLRTLNISGFGIWQEGDIKHFPRKLTSLTLHADASGLSGLPKTLESIVLDFAAKYMTVKEMETLPQGLKSFSAPIASLGAPLVASLPRRLLHLHLPATRNTFSLSEFSQRFDQLLTLDLSSYDQPISDEPPAFPPSLASLSLGDWELTKVFMDTLPRTLLSFNVGTTSKVQEFFGLFVPPRLQSLVLRNMASLPEECLDYMPKHVLYFATAMQHFRGLDSPKLILDCSSEHHSDVD